MSEQTAIRVPAGNENILVRWDQVTLDIAFATPCITGFSTSDAWRHERRDEREQPLAGCQGTLIRDTFSNGDLRLHREVWVEHGEQSMAMRQTLENASGRSLSLDELRPMHCAGPEGLTIDGLPAGRWEVLRQARLKNAIPSAVRLATFDEDYEHAIQTVGEQGDLPVGVDGQSVRLEIDSFGIVRSNDPASDAHLLFGLLSQTGHLAQFELETDEARQTLARLTAHCVFDGCQLDTGCERTSQWVILKHGTGATQLIQAYVDRVAAYHDVVEPSAEPPSVWCSWYYYGPYFYEEQLHKELAYLTAHRLPFEVLLIDDSRPRPWGDWLSHDRWPSGMKDAADRIRSLGYQPGIWTCPYLAKLDSHLAREHPHWLLKQADGEPVLFKMDGTSYVLDPTHPEVDAFLESLFRLMTREWGFTYHKLDFMRGVFMNARARYFDRHATRLDAYRRGLEAIRRGAGAEAYISVCGGHYGGSIGLADSQRSGSDVVACWDDPPALPMIKQNLLRTWMNRLWHTDADSMMVRRRQEPINDTAHGRLSLGRFSDAEARSIAANQYVGGGIVCATECFDDIQPDRLALYRHVIPVVRSEGGPLDYFNPSCPSRMLNRITPRCEALGPWVTVTAFNWDDAVADLSVTLTPSVLANIEAERYLVFEFVEQRVLGLKRAGETVVLPSVAAHDCRVVRIVPWSGGAATLAGTDLHFSGGGVEVSAWQATATEAAGVISTSWRYPVQVTVAFPTDQGCEVRTVTVAPGGGPFVVGVDAGARSASGA